MEYKVNQPDYYHKDRKISPFDVIIDWQLDFFMGNVVKYIGRFFRKPDPELTPEQKAVQDIDKMIVYLQKEKEIIVSNPNYIPYDSKGKTSKS